MALPMVLQPFSVGARFQRLVPYVELSLATSSDPPFMDHSMRKHTKHESPNSHYKKSKVRFSHFGVLHHAPLCCSSQNSGGA